MAVHDGEEVVEVMCNASCQRSNGLHLLSLEKLGPQGFPIFLSPLALGNVRYYGSAAVELPAFILYRNGLQLSIKVSAIFSSQLDFKSLLGLSLKTLLEIQVVSIPELLTDKARRTP